MFHDGGHTRLVMDTRTPTAYDHNVFMKGMGSNSSLVSDHNKLNWLVAAILDYKLPPENIKLNHLEKPNCKNMVKTIK